MDELDRLRYVEETARSALDVYFDWLRGDDTVDSDDLYDAMRDLEKVLYADG